VLDSIKIRYNLVNELKCNASCFTRSDSVATLIEVACMYASVTLMFNVYRLVIIILKKCVQYMRQRKLLYLL